MTSPDRAPDTQPAGGPLDALRTLPRVTALTIAACLVVTAIEFARYGTSPTPQELYDAGGFTVDRLRAGQWSVVLTSSFLHANVMHVFSNCAVLLVMGSMLERAIGSPRMIAIVFASMGAATIGEVVGSASNAVVVGASGIAFGMIGAALAADGRRRTAVGATALMLLVLNVVVTFVIPNISKGGHIGGLIGGFLVCLVLGGAGELDRRLRSGEIADLAGRRDDAVVGLQRGDIAAVTADAIVNAASGDELEPGEAVPAPGDAVVTPAGTLTAAYLVRAVGPQWHGGESGEADLLSSAVRRAIEVADEVGCRSVAMPAISTGTDGYPDELAAPVALRAIVAAVGAARSVRHVTVVLHSDAQLATWRSAADALDAQPVAGVGPDEPNP